MKIISWNVNGLRANIKKGCFGELLSSGADVICLQETKVHIEQLPEDIKNPLGYTGYFDHSKVKKGYSGVAIYLKNDSPLGRPEKVEYGMGVEEMDQEGRFIALFFKDFVLITLYFPNGGGGEDRLDYKMRFYSHFLKYINKIRDSKDAKEIIFCGDVNTAHNEIDIARPKENENHTGFLRIERDWLDEVVKNGYVDVWRKMNPEKIKYTWWDMKTFARERNVGWRIDYFFVSENFFSRVKDAKILNEVFGSDHCPISLDLK
ncbi:MAG: exodeoxyribonuclease III [bacterium]|nr:exodeoxyribonuclease III [bacterium]